MNYIQDTLPSVLIVDDDVVFCEVLADALADRGYATSVAHNIDEALLAAERQEPEFAVIDLRIGQESGLVLVEKLHAMDENTRIVILTGYASIATAVEAIKLGAVHYLAKPADADEILLSLHKVAGDAGVVLTDSPLTVRRLEWEHLQKVLTDCEGNISAAARRLRMHRRTLQRKLAKKPVKD
ncbi:MAG: response regulator transcription factor [Thiogranum sp.]|nr:response regulator transcription factor [Thiogranum sp.]